MIVLVCSCMGGDEVGRGEDRTDKGEAVCQVKDRLTSALKKL